MPVAGNLGNHLNQGVAQLCESIDSTGELFDHGLPGVPAAVLFVCQVAAGAPTICVPGYDSAASTATQMKLYTNSGSATDWIVIPLSGTTIGAR